MILNDEFETACEEVVIAYFKTVSQNVHEGTEENREKLGLDS
jgi:hypothetical protein